MIDLNHPNSPHREDVRPIRRDFYSSNYVKIMNGFYVLFLDLDWSAVFDTEITDQCLHFLNAVACPTFMEYDKKENWQDVTKTKELHREIKETFHQISQSMSDVEQTVFDAVQELFYD